MTDPQIAPAGSVQPQASLPIPPAAVPQPVVSQAPNIAVPAAQPVATVVVAAAPTVAAPVAAVQPVAVPVAPVAVAPQVVAPQAVAPPAAVAQVPAGHAVPTPAAAPKAAPAAAPSVTAAKPAAKAPPAAKSAPTKPAAGKVKTVILAPSYRDRLQSVTFMEWANSRIREAPGYLVSIFLHAVIFFLLSMAVMPAKDREELFNTIVAKTEAPEQVNEKLDDTQIIPEKLENLEASASEMQVNAEVVADRPSPIEVDVSDSPPTIEAPDPTAGGGPNMPKGELAGRSQKARGAMLASQGGTAASELAVNSGLKWIARHQRPDGSWSFKHGMDDPGAIDNPTGATGLALLAFLGGGHTHKAGDYQKQVGGGLNFLVSKMTQTGDVRAGADMYTQGICTIALCEAYALSKDKNLRQPTQAAVNFIVNAQDPAGGGWRYQPGQKGDTSVVGWQVMALKSAKIGKLQVPNKTIGKATFFLNYVQAENGAKYGYDAPGAGPATSAVGLLCRMYLGWTPKNQGLVKGVEFLSNTGPNPGNIYFDYYATQVLHHWGGEPWTKWNNVMREYLVTTQEKAGNAAGSWKPLTGHDDVSGGRHYRTCMSVMTLEVYYRHLPIYQRETIKVDF